MLSLAFEGHGEVCLRNKRYCCNSLDYRFDNL